MYFLLLVDFSINFCFGFEGILILGIAMLPIWAVWLNAESLLVLLQQSPCVARSVILGSV